MIQFLGNELSKYSPNSESSIIQLNHYLLEIPEVSQLANIIAYGLNDTYYVSIILNSPSYTKLIIPYGPGLFIDSIN